MKQKQIRTTTEALNGITKAIGGATEHGAAIGLAQYTAASLTAKKTSLVNAENAVDEAKAELATRQSTQASVLLTAIAFITLARDMLKPRLGKKRSTAWEAVGFSSFILPRNVAQAKFKLQKLVTFLTANPDAESAERNITAVRAQALLDDLIAKENAVTAQRTAVGNALKAKNSALNVVIRAIGGLVSELRGLLSPTDMIYLSFGLNKPGAKAIPSIPANLIAVLVGPSAIALKWDRSERAERYRIYKKVVGVDDALIAVESREDLDFVLEGLPSGKTIQLALSAVNDGGESQLSETVSVVMP